MGKPAVLKAAYFATARDIGSWVFGATFLGPSRFDTAVAHYDVYWAMATAASLSMYISNTALGTTQYGNILVQGSTTVNMLHHDEFCVKGSQFFNLCFGVTTTISWLNVVERTEW